MMDFNKEFLREVSWFLWKVIFVSDHSQGAERCESTFKIISKGLKISAVFITDQTLKFYTATPFPKKDLVQTITSYDPRLVVFDLKHPLKEKDYKKLKSLGVKLINHNHTQASNAFDVNLLMFRLYGGNKPGYYEGAEYTALHKDFYTNGIKIRRHARRIVVCDVNNEFWKDVMKKTDASLTFVSEVNADCVKSHDITIMPIDYAAIQSLATGIPTLLFARSEEENKIATNLVNTNAAVNLGLVFKKKPKEIQRIICKVLCGYRMRRDLSHAAKCLVNRKTWDNLHMVYKKTLEG
jgi:spore coat polysaccharide biosynthesis predicted glycosyltransferase SpsG